MLYTETIARNTFELLKLLMREELLSNFCLAGGTALSLQIGHRISVDLDLFTNHDFEPNELQEMLMEKYNFKTSFLRGRTLKGSIDEIKIDCICHKYNYIEPINEFDGIRLLSLSDIAAMKLGAIADNGSRIKDFIDIAYLSDKLSLEQMLDAYETKYPDTTSIRALKALTYFNDIDFNEPIKMVDAPLDWGKIKNRLYNMIDNSSEIFS